MANERNLLAKSVRKQLAWAEYRQRPGLTYIHMNPTRVFSTVMIVASILLGCSPLQQANKQANKNKITVLYPSMAFDSLQAKTALAYGKTNIEGVVYTKPRTQFGYKAPLGGKIIGRNVRVILYPATPYLREWHRLRARKENKRTHVYLSEAAARYCIVTTTDDYGRFKFEQLKPGEYILHTIIGWSEGKSYNQYEGSGYNNYGGTTDYYSKKYYYVNKSERIERFVTVDKNGGTMEVNLR